MQLWRFGFRLARIITFLAMVAALTAPRACARRRASIDTSDVTSAVLETFPSTPYASHAPIRSKQSRISRKAEMYEKRR
jgi:hypothetical protein